MYINYRLSRTWNSLRANTTGRYLFDNFHDRCSQRITNARRSLYSSFSLFYLMLFCLQALVFRSLPPIPLVSLIQVPVATFLRFRKIINLIKLAHNVLNEPDLFRHQKLFPFEVSTPYFNVLFTSYFYSKKYVSMTSQKHNPRFGTTFNISTTYQVGQSYLSSSWCFLMS